MNAVWNVLKFVSDRRPSDECGSIQEGFSGYIDGAVSGRKMQQIAAHLERCPACREEFQKACRIQQQLGALGPVRPPSDLALRLRLAISHESSRSAAAQADLVRLRWQNAVRPFLLQASAGLAGTIVLLGGIALLVGIVAAPQTVMANDEPLGAMTAPHYMYSAARPRAIQTTHDTTIVVEASVNDRGQVYDYRIVSGPEESAVQQQVLDQLLLSVFEPARVFGIPIRGHVVLTYEGISVRG